MKKAIQKATQAAFGESHNETPGTHSSKMIRIHANSSSSKTHTLFAIAISFLAFFALLAPLAVQAAFLTNIPQTLVQPDGTHLEALASGDEHYNWIHDKDGHVIVRDPESGWWAYAEWDGGKAVATANIAGETDAKALASLPTGVPSGAIKSKSSAYSLAGFTQMRAELASAKSNPATKGDINNIVIFIRFQDDPEYSDAPARYEGIFNNAADGANSVKKYYHEVSYGQLNLNTSFYPTASGATVVSHRDPHPRGYFEPYDATTNPQGVRDDDNEEQWKRTINLAMDAMDSVTGQIPANLNLDTNSDGAVDSLSVVIYGAPSGWSSLLWPHQVTLGESIGKINGKDVTGFAFLLNDALSVGVLCHELFHTMGAPDLYHYTYDGVNPTGRWDLMCEPLEPPQHMSYYMKWRYGKWVSEVAPLTAAGAANLAPLVNSTHSAVRVNSPNSSDEYFILEYRKRQGTFESSLPGSGLIVYRINTRADGRGNENGPPDEVYTYRPDGAVNTNGHPKEGFLTSDTSRTTLGGQAGPAVYLANGAEGGLEIREVGPALDTIQFNVANGSFPQATPSPTPSPTPDPNSSSDPTQVTEISIQSPRLGDLRCEFERIDIVGAGFAGQLHLTLNKADVSGLIGAVEIAGLPAAGRTLSAPLNGKVLWNAKQNALTLSAKATGKDCATKQSFTVNLTGARNGDALLLKVTYQINLMKPSRKIKGTQNLQGALINPNTSARIDNMNFMAKDASGKQFTASGVRLQAPWGDTFTGSATIVQKAASSKQPSAVWVYTFKFNARQIGALSFTTSAANQNAPSSLSVMSATITLFSQRLQASNVTIFRTAQRLPAGLAEPFPIT